MLKSPKKTYKFNGNQNIEDYILNSLSNNHLHHAYLLSGIKGIGKATFAYRVSRYLLSGSKEDNLYIGKSEKTSNLIEKTNWNIEYQIEKTLEDLLQYWMDKIK